MKTQGGSLVRAAGDKGSPEACAIWEGPMPPKDDRPVKDKPERPCARCGKRFQLTVKRHLLCASCFRLGNSGMG